MPLKLLVAVGDPLGHEEADLTLETLDQDVGLPDLNLDLLDFTIDLPDFVLKLVELPINTLLHGGKLLIEIGLEIFVHSP
ncbi:MAG TPA: hypothetical protein VJ885_14040 [Thermoanaerobaculia bacterium]|nr:hypothetical protein [Thermoanaerobaculia bacterium]